MSEPNQLSYADPKLRRFRMSSLSVLVALLLGVGLAGGTIFDKKEPLRPFGDTFTSSSIFGESVEEASDELKDAISIGDIEEASRILTAELRPKAIAEGFKDSKHVQSFDRNQDRDVVAFKALATAALRGNVLQRIKLATAVVESLTPPEGFPIGYTKIGLIGAFTSDFNNEELMEEIVDADANIELGRRKLLCACTPVASDLCSSCWPSQSCSKMFWC